MIEHENINEYDFLKVSTYFVNEYFLPNCMTKNDGRKLNCVFLFLLSLISDLSVNAKFNNDLYVL